MRAADGATDPDCASVIVRLPETIDDNERRETDAQATGAWGSPATILLTCGLDTPAPSELRCVTLDGVDWLIDDSDEDRGVFTTYGREPAVQVVVDHVTSDSNALYALAEAVGTLPVVGACTSPEDTPSSDDLVES